MDFPFQINDFFGSWLKINPDIITALVIVLCAILFLLSFASSRHAKFVPGLMVSIGICGTFWGTFIALSEFHIGAGSVGIDHEAMVESIPKVLGGMKSAFLTSLIGLGSALITRIVFLFLHSRKSHQPTDETMKDLLTQIKDGISGEKDGSLYSQMHELRAEYRDGTGAIESAIRQSLSGENDSSVVAHLIKIRNESHANFQELNKTMEGLSNIMRTEIVGSVREMKDELQKAIIEQLAKMQGDNQDNFQTLNKTMDGLSDTIRTEIMDGVREMKDELQKAVVEQLAKMQGDNQDNFQALNKIMEGLSDTISTALVDSMKELKDEMRDAITNQLAPQLERTNNFLRDRLEEMMKELNEQLVKQFGKSFEEFNAATQAIKAWQEKHREQVDQLTTAFDLTARGIQGIRDNCETIPATMDSLKTLMGELDLRLQAFANMKQQAEQSFPVIKQNLDKIGEDMQESSKGFSGLEKVITETFAKSTELAQQQVKTVEESVQICLREMQLALTKMAEDHAQVINEQISAITREWGENMVSIARECADTIEKVRK